MSDQENILKNVGKNVEMSGNEMPAEECMKMMNSDECARSRKTCTTHNCAMVRKVEKVQKWTKLKHGYAFRTRAVVIWKCSLIDDQTENHETSLQGRPSSNMGLNQL